MRHALLLVAALLVLVAAAAWRGARPPPPEVHFSGGDCIRCHGRVRLANHDRAFVATGHGAAARANRAGCLSCHQEAACAACHARQVPEWHSLALLAPDQGPEAWRAHAREAALRRSACHECHAQSFLRHCAGCHPRGILDHAAATGAEEGGRE